MRQLRTGTAETGEEVRMTFGEHLEELRWRVIKAFFGAVVGTVVCFAFGDEVFEFLLQPLNVALRNNDQEPVLAALKPAETFIVYIKMCFIVGLVISCPYVIYQIWAFVAAGLYAHEKRYVRVFGPFSLGLFVAGVAFCYYVVVPISLNFLIGFSRMFPEPRSEPTGIQRLLLSLGSAGLPETRPATTSGPAVPVTAEDPTSPKPGQMWIDPVRKQLKIYVPGPAPGKGGQTGGRVWASPLTPAVRTTMVKPSFSLAYYISFVTAMALAFGIGFQVPIVVIFLAWSGIVEADDIARARRYVILGLVTLAAILTPPDVQSQILLAIPMWGLFELGLLLARVLPSRFGRRPPDESETPE